MFATSVKKYALGSGGLASINVGHDAKISGFFQ
jgi:hypothetical protein